MKIEDKTEFVNKKKNVKQGGQKKKGQVVKNGLQQCRCGRQTSLGAAKKQIDAGCERKRKAKVEATV